MLFGKTRIYPGTFTTLATKKQFPLENRCKFKVVEIIKFQKFRLQKQIHHDA